MSVEGWNLEPLKGYERIGGPETPEKLAETERFATEDRDKFLHETGARQPDALNPNHWAIDAHAFAIPASRAFMSRILMNLATNVQHYPAWNAYLKNRQPKTLIVWGRNDPLIMPAAAEIGEAERADGRAALFRRRPLRAGRVRRPDRRGDHRDVFLIGISELRRLQRGAHLGFGDRLLRIT
jgi:hypothetical protein